MQKIERANNETYEIHDFNTGEMTVSTTRLRIGKQTKGHSHQNKEIYYFQSGFGMIEIGNEKHPVMPGDFIEIDSNVFHRVYNISHSEELVFVCSWINSEVME